MDKSVLYPTQSGTPQGGVASPVLANLALDGLQKALRERFPKLPTGSTLHRVNMVRYADDCMSRTHKEERWSSRRYRMWCCIGDGGRPSGAALQGEAPNHRKLLRSRAVVVSVAEKAHQMRQVWTRKANASEPLMKVSKAYRWHQNEEESLPRMESGRDLSYCPGGARHEGGASLVRALVRNWRTCRPDAKGEAQAAGTVRARVPMRGTGADRLVVVMKPGNAGGAKGAGCPGLLAGQPQGRSR